MDKSNHNLTNAHSIHATPVRLEISSSKGISIATLLHTSNNCIPPFSHAHAEYEFLIPHTPMPFLQHEDIFYLGEVGFVYPVQSNRNHGLQYTLTNTSHTNITVDRDYFEALLQQLHKTDLVFNYHFPLTKELLFYIDTYKEEYKKEAATELKLDYLAKLICIELIHCGSSKASDTRRQEKYHYQKGIRNVTDFLNENYTKEINISELAEISGFSKHYFIRTFKAMIGESPYSYINKLRLTKAKHLLTSHAHSIEEIALLSGFKNTSSFSSLFKSHMGITPSQFRKQKK